MTGPLGHNIHGNNVAAVEPFIHQPLKQISPPLPLSKSQSQSQFISSRSAGKQQQQQFVGNNNSQQQQQQKKAILQQHQQVLIQNHVQTTVQHERELLKSECDDNKLWQLERGGEEDKEQHQPREDEMENELGDDGEEFSSSSTLLKKNDPKYQTLPYNTKFNGLSTSKSSPNIQSMGSHSATSSPQSASSCSPSSSSSSSAAASPPQPKVTSPPSTNASCPSIADVATSSKDSLTRTNECDSEKIKETVKQHQHIRQPSQQPTSMRSGIQKPSKVALNLSSELNKINKSSPQQPQIGTMAVPPRKPISSVAPTTMTTTTSSATMIPKIVPKMVQMVAPNNSQIPVSSMEAASGSPRPALPPKPSGSAVSSSPQSSDTETRKPGTTTTTKSSLLSPPTVVQKSKSANSIPTIVSVINKQQQSPRGSDGSENNNNKKIPVPMKVDAEDLLLTTEPHLPIKAKPLTIKKQPLHEQPKLKASAAAAAASSGIAISATMKPYLSRRIEMPPSFLFPEVETAELKAEEMREEQQQSQTKDETDKVRMVPTEMDVLTSSNSLHNKSSSISSMSSANSERNGDGQDGGSGSSVARRSRLSNGGAMGNGGVQKVKLARRVSFDPLALLLDASLEGELELVRKTATQVPNPSAANDEGITALHNAICAGHLEIVK